MQSDQVTERPSDWVTEWPSDQVTEWHGDRVTGWPGDWVTERPSDIVTEWPSDWVTKWQEASQTIDRKVYLLIIWFPRSRFHLLHPGHHYREIHDCLPSILQGQSRGIIRPAAKLLKSLLIHPKLSHSVQCQHKCTHWDTDFIDILERGCGWGSFQISISSLIKTHLLLWLIWPYMTLL